MKILTLEINKFLFFNSTNTSFLFIFLIEKKRRIIEVMGLKFKLFLVCIGWQPYTINSAKVIFLNQRPQSRACKGASNACFTCDRILQEPFHFCSLSCKVCSHFPVSCFCCLNLHKQFSS